MSVLLAVNSIFSKCIPISAILLLSCCSHKISVPANYLNRIEIDSIRSAEDDLIFTKILSTMAKNRLQCYYPSFYDSSSRIYIVEKKYSTSVDSCVLIVVSASNRISGETERPTPIVYYEANCFLSIKEANGWKMACIKQYGIISDISLNEIKERSNRSFRSEFSEVMEWPYLIDDIRFFDLDVWKDEKLWSDAVSEF